MSPSSSQHYNNRDNPVENYAEGEVGGSSTGRTFAGGAAVRT